MMLFFSSLEGMVVFSLSGILSLFLYDMLIRIPFIRGTFHTEHSQSLSGRLSNAFIVFLLIWKLSPLVFSLKEVMANPIFLVYAPGGLAGGISAMVLSLLYMLPLLPGGKRTWAEASQASLRDRLIWAGFYLLLFFAVWLSARVLFAHWSASRLNPAFV